MDSMNFTEAIIHRTAFEKASVVDFRRWLVSYPWCHSLHMLLLKKMHDNGDPAFPEQLHRSAIHVPDRTVLYYLIHTDRFHRVVDPIPTVKPIQDLPTVVAEPVDIPDPALSHPAPAEPVEQEAEMAETVSPIAETEEKVEGNDLITKFIQAEPRIVPREGDFSEAIAVAEKSNVFHTDLVTETLGNIYLQQGNKNMAIKIFQQLSLTIPEKSSYFAARIEEIRKNVNRL